MPGWLVGASPLNPSSSIATIEIELTTLYELRDGQIVRVHQYDTLEAALEAAGVRE